jgi:hypothetical protein
MRIALIHAVPMAIPPVAAAFDALWPEAERLNLLDDSLSVDRQRAGALTPAAAGRPELAGVDALMLAQFSMAPARDAVQAAVRCPVLTSPASAVRKLKRLLAQRFTASPPPPASRSSGPTRASRVRRAGSPR